MTEVDDFLSDQHYTTSRVTCEVTGTSKGKRLKTINHIDTWERAFKPPPISTVLITSPGYGTKQQDFYFLQNHSTRKAQHSTGSRHQPADAILSNEDTWR